MEDYYRGICPKYVNWKHKHDVDFCKGKWIRSVCNFGVGDLHRIQSSSCLFANKFNLEVDRDAVFLQLKHIIDISLNETTLPYV